MEDAVPSLERELKYSLVDAPPASAEVEALGRGGPYAFVALDHAVHVDTYFDDDALSLARSGWALRTRRALADRGGSGEPDGGGARQRSEVGLGGAGARPAAVPRPPALATLKSAGHVADGLHQREEIEAPMRGGDWPPSLVERLTTFVEPWALRPRLSLEVDRARYRVTHDGRPLATLAIDRVTARLPYAERTAHFDEVEIEALGDADEAALRGAAELLDALVRLTPTSVSKVERAAAVLALGASF